MERCGQSAIKAAKCLAGTKSRTRSQAACENCSYLDGLSRSSHKAVTTAEASRRGTMRPLI